MHFSGSKKEKRDGMTVGGKTKGKVLMMGKHNGELIDKSVIYSLCSEGNRRIIQTSYNKTRLHIKLLLLLFPLSAPCLKWELLCHAWLELFYHRT